jgi:DNA-directed RNA polymerase subunit G
MSWSKTFEGIVEELKPGNIRGQYIAKINLKDHVLVHDVIEGTLELNVGEKVKIYVGEKVPDDLDSYDFCGHGYLVASEDSLGKTILSLWGIIFKFEPKIGLKEDRKYYLCIKKLT